MNDNKTGATAAPSKPLLIAVTGGIGSGKSVVCRILSSLGYQIYDCDSRAKKLMEESDAIKETLKREITPEAVNPDGSINRRAIADVVFSDPGKLAILDSAVHSAVTADILRWRDNAIAATPAADLLFVETAIPIKSGLYRLVDDIWEVTAPEEVRVARAVSRDNSTEEAVRSRIASQKAESPSLRASANPDEGLSCRVISNDGSTPLLPAILELLALYK
ncbi:MAG: dephospho-CoA kinase [[Clostridium] fimetarium]|nr:dephospho-CoA kinase [Alistipes timonensis]MCM1404968.1 dephospho-CoA kinase [[Clostridium] fimetarium]